MKKLGLALGGGGARGCAHIGVIKALEEANIPISCVAGTSIGAMVGGMYAAGNLKDFEEYLLTIKWMDVLTQFDPTLRNGMFSGNKISRLIQKLIDGKTFSDCKIPFSAVATNLNTGKEVHLNHGSIADAIRASISLPGILATVEHKGEHLLDGAVLNPLPINVTRKLGAQVVLAVDLDRQLVFKNSKASPQAPKKWWDFGLWSSSTSPSMIEVMEGAMFLTQKALTQQNLEKHPADLLLSLQLSDARLFDFHKAKELIEEGYRETKRIIPELKKLLAS